MTTAELADLIARKCDLPVSGEDFLTEVNERASELIANPPMMSGVDHLVTHLRNCCIELGLVTSCTEANYCAKIQEGRSSSRTSRLWSVPMTGSCGPQNQNPMST